MEMRQLRYFLALSETGSFSRAAELCHVAQPSLSQQIQRLEQELECLLFDRLPRGAVLTEAGHKFLVPARNIIETAEQAALTIKAGKNEVAGRLSVGVIPTMAPYFLPSLLPGFVKRYPLVALTVHEHVTERLIDLLASGSLDIAVTSLPVRHTLLHAEQIAEEELLIAAGKKHRFAGRKSVRWQDIAEDNFLVLHEMHCLAEQTLNFCRQQGTDPRVVMRGEQLSTIMQLVANDMGVSLVPRMAADTDRSRRRSYIRLRDVRPARAIAIVWHLHRFRTDAARAFEKTLKDYFS